jgi:pSer/pThr/pTyr-binding forkhead associated (FHA) protein
MAGMASAQKGPHPATAVELKAQMEAERAGVPFVLYRDDAGEQRIVALGTTRRTLSIGRRESTDVSLSWDGEVSGLHAQVEVLGEDCALVDDGLSRNGSYVNGDRIHGRRRLRDGDVLRFGKTLVVYRAPVGGTSDSTLIAGDLLSRASVSEAQRRVLLALCRPFKDSSDFATPATNQQIADGLFLSVDAVKTHLRALFAKFEVEDLPQNTKRLALVERALQSGIVSPRDL